jgi:hypothetical protein
MCQLMNENKVVIVLEGVCWEWRYISNYSICFESMQIAGLVERKYKRVQ